MRDVGNPLPNYFVPVDGQIGQTAVRQIDCLVQLGRFFKNEERQCWRMENGYALPTEGGLSYITEQLGKLNPTELTDVKSLLRVGIQWGSEPAGRANYR